MKPQHKKIHLSFLAVLVVTMSVFSQNPETPGEHTHASVLLGRVILGGEGVGRSRTDPFTRQAVRLRRRLEKHSFSVPPLGALIEALAKRRILLGHATTVTFATSDATVFAPWTIAVGAYPHWVRPTFTSVRAGYAIDPDTIERTVRERATALFPGPEDATVTATSVDKRGVLRAETTGTAKAGYVVNPAVAARGIEQALMHGVPEIGLVVTRTPGKIQNATAEDFGALELLAEGRSNFAGSITGRVSNVRKGLKDHVNNVLVPPGATFSFNSTLGTVTLGNGWYEALGIFNGDELRPVPGGGICQVATTTYRAILGAGLPVIARKSHSLFVIYYAKHGVGLDATVFPGSQDLQFVNDTGRHLLVQAYSDGFDAFVNIYGTKDGRSIALEGPFLATNAPEGFTVNGRPMVKTEIAWVQKITYSDGRVQANTVVSRYKTIPKDIVVKYGTPVPPSGGGTEHAAANPQPLQASVAQ